MIKIEHIIPPSPEQMEFIIEGMRNPMNSWDKSDSEFEHYEDGFIDGYIGDKDLELMQKLSKAGKDHRKYMRMMTVYMRITAPLYWWKEFDTYKVGTVANSCSTMHKIADKEFEIGDFSNEYIHNLYILENTIEELNKWRYFFNHYENQNDVFKEQFNKKDCWRQMIVTLPSNYNQTRNVMVNYEVLANMYHSRKNHKLDEWVEFCKKIERLPHSEIMTGE